MMIIKKLKRALAVGCLALHLPCTAWRNACSDFQRNYRPLDLLVWQKILQPSPALAAHDLQSLRQGLRRTLPMPSACCVVAMIASSFSEISTVGVATYS
jgi:hypothetical protein